MRAHTPFPVRLATTALLLASVFLPVSLLAGSHRDHAPKQTKTARHAQAIHPRSNVHTVRRHHEKLAGLTRPRLRHARVQRAGSEDAAASKRVQKRVHDWVKNNSAKNQQTPSAEAIDAANRDVQPEQGVSAPPSEPAQSGEAKHISTIVNIRPADAIGAIRAQLPLAQKLTEPLLPESTILPTLYTRRGRLIMPPAMKGSHEILIRQNQMADNDGLDRIRDDADLERMQRAGTLIAIPTNNTLRADERLPANRRYCRPWTALFLDTLARQHYAHFQTALQVNSAVRTVEFQQRLIHSNGNAAPAEGDTASPHLTGQAVDIAKHGLSMAEIAWLRGYLLPLVQQGKVDVEEEFQQSCFHISVYKKYMPQGPVTRRVIATTHREGMTALGVTLR